MGRNKNKSTNKNRNGNKSSNRHVSFNQIMVETISEQRAKEILRMTFIILFLRIGAVLVLAQIYSQGWHVKWVWRVLPVMAFQASPGDFTIISSYSVLIVMIVVSVWRFLYNRKTEDDKSDWRMQKVITCIGVGIIIVQTLIALFLNRYVQFAMDTTVAVLIIMVGVVVCSLMLVKWREDSI